MLSLKEKNIFYLLIILDTTGTMKAWIEEAKKSLVQTIEGL